MEDTGQPSVQEMVTALGGDPKDPRLQLFMQLLESQRASRPAPTDARESSDERLQRTRRKVKRLEAAYSALAERNAELAAACGACVCWGDERCTLCRGRGRPGWRPPEGPVFLAYVAPALRRLGLLRDEEVSSSTEQTGSEPTTKEQ